MTSKTKGIVVYLSIAFGMAWILWEIPLQMGLTISNPLFQLVVLPGAFSPAVACLIVRKWVTREGFADAGLKLNLRKSWPYYLFAWLLPLLVIPVIVILTVALGIAQPDFSLQRAFGELAPGQSMPPELASLVWLLPIQALITALIATPLLWGEEFGWRGYLQIRLLSDRPLLAAVATGLIWGVWHYPLNLRGYNFPEHPLLGLLVFPVSLVLISIVFGWLRLRTGSVWSASLAHAATNSVGGSLLIMLFVGGAPLVLVSYLGILSWVPLGALCAWIISTGRFRPEAAKGRS